MSQTLRGRLFRLSPNVFGKEISLNELFENVSDKKIVILGEYHGNQPIINLQIKLQEHIAHSMNRDNGKSLPKLRVVLEHFSVAMNPLLSKYNSGAISISELVEEYKNIGTEGFDLDPYKSALESSKKYPNIEFYGGFIPRTFARLLMKEGKDTAIDEARKAGFISPEERLDGTDQHYNYFESLLTGRNIQNDPLGTLASDRFRKMFPAQIIKDASMAWFVKNLKSLDLSGDDKILIVCGIGHMLYSHGVPERMFSNGIRKDELLRIACLPTSDRHIFQRNDYHEHVMLLLKNAYGGPESNAADFCFLYTEDSISDENEDEIRGETQETYDKVGATAHLPGGDLQKARSILKFLHYTIEEIDFVNEDAVNYQGVACPHRHANIKPGDKVIDLGSGLGVDSLIAMKAAGDTGQVIGVDLSHECVKHANKRARERGVGNILSFIASPIENLRRVVSENSFDVAISNGAFCLLPNKAAGFSQCFSVLKPGGRIAICTTVVKDPLDSHIEWPLCMRVFSNLDDIVPLLQKIGFVDIVIDMTDSLVDIEVPIEEHESPTNSDSGRFKVHNNDVDDNFRHLKSYNMNDLCARIVIKAKKPI